MLPSALRVSVVSSCAITAVVFTAVCSKPAFADEIQASEVASKAKPVEEKDATRARPWKLTTGFGFGTLYGGLVGPLVGGAPGGFIMCERHLVGPLWLLGRFGAEYARSSASLGAHTSLAAVGGGAGLRVAFTSPKVLEVSVYALVGGDYDFAVSTLPSTLRTARSTNKTSSFGGQLGAALDREIVPGFGIRVSTAVARATYATSTSHVEDGQGNAADSTAHQSTLELLISPAFELRWSF